MTPRPVLSTRQASRKTAEAADQLLGWLEQQGIGTQNGTSGGQAEPGRPAGGGAKAPSPASLLPPVPENALQGCGEASRPGRGIDQGSTRRTGRADDPALLATPLRPQHTDWLHHWLFVAGPAGLIADFQAAARGAGTVPWRLDGDRMEEDLFLMLAAPPPPQRRRLSLAGARTLAGQLRDAAERRHTVAVARVGQNQAALVGFRGGGP